MARNAHLRRQLQVLCRLIDGRPKKLIDFEDIYENMHPRTIRRDLDEWADIPEANIIVTQRDGLRWYRMAKVPVATKVKRTHKECAKCPEKGKQDINNFGKNAYSPDGHDWVCRTCRSAQRNVWAQENREHVNKKQMRNYYKRKKRSKG